MPPCRRKPAGAQLIHARNASNGNPCEATFDITELMAVTVRHLQARPPAGEARHGRDRAQLELPALEC
ncbi:MAG TPA: hypothetical protein VLA79_20815 [Polyangia bacterium]|nr:hypothetical protein [Polyangia bacterium]